MEKFVWIVYEIYRGKESLFGVFSSEARQVEACKEFEATGEYRVEQVRLDP